MKLSEIKIGTRHRRDLGDVEALASSLDTVGLLHPIVVNGSHELIVGARRLAAAKQLGWKDVPATVADTLDDVHRALLAERDENTCRKDFTPTEAVEMAKALEPFERKSAKERQKAGRPPVNFTEGGETRQKVAAAVGMSPPTLAKAAAVAEAAEEHPGDYADLRERMDTTGKVNGAYKELVRRQEEEGKPKTRTPHRVVDREFIPDTDPDDPFDPDKFPVPDGPTPAEIVSRKPIIIYGKLIQEVWSAVNSFHHNGTLKMLKAETGEAERKKLARDIRNVIAELEKVASKLE